MENVILIISIALVILGTFFSVIGVLGYFRLPDVYTRLHTTGKVAVFGAVFFLVAAILMEDAVWGYGLILIFFIIASGPATSHAIAAAANRTGIKRLHAVRDDLLQNKSRVDKQADS